MPITDSSILRVAGNLLAGHRDLFAIQSPTTRQQLVEDAVAYARALAEQVERTTPPMPEVQSHAPQRR